MDGKKETGNSDDGRNETFQQQRGGSEWRQDMKVETSVKDRGLTEIFVVGYYQDRVP